MITTKARIGSSQVLFNAAQDMGLRPSWITENSLFVVHTPSSERYISKSLNNLNSQKSVNLARNKYVTRLILDRHGLPNIPYALATSQADAQRFLNQHGTMIVKPSHGLGATNIHIVRTADQLRGLDVSGCILEKYAPGIEMRYLVLNKRVIGVHESRYGESVQADRYLERISYDETTWNHEQSDIALNVAKILGLSFAAVDFMVDESGKPRVLEVNTSPGMKWFHAPSEGPVVDVARLFLEAVVLDADSQAV